MTDLHSRIEAAKQEIASLKSTIDDILQSKNDSGFSSGSSMTPIRIPPNTKVRRTLKGHFGKVTALHWAGDSRSLVSASQDGNLLLWNAVTSNKLQSIHLKSSYVMSVGLEQTRHQLVACGGLDNLCTVYNLAQNASATEMASHDGFLSCCRFVDEQTLLTSSGDSTCIRWNVPRAQVVNTFAEHSQDVMFLAMATPSHANVFASASVDQSAKLWDLRTPAKSIQTFVGKDGGDINCIDFMPSSDGTVFATCTGNGTLQVWDVRAYNVLQEWQVPSEGTDGFTSVAFSKSGRLLFAGHSDANLRAFDIMDAQQPAFVVPQAHERHISCLGVSPNGDALCSGSWDSNLKVWA